MSDFPAPPVPADLDISKLDGFMLDTRKLLSSELLALSTGDEFKAAVTLWCRAWQQTPACSLPDDDRVLAAFAGYARDPNGWADVREVALRGFIKCSDGRLYHKVLAADALRAAEALEKRRQRTAAATAARARPKPPPNDPRGGHRNDQRDDDVTSNVTRSHRRDGTGEEVKKESTPPTTVNVPAREEGGGGGGQTTVSPRVAITRRLCSIIGVDWDDPTWFGNGRVVESWLANGWDPEQDIYPTVAAVIAERRKVDPDFTPGNFNYFAKSIARAHRDRTDPARLSRLIGNGGPAQPQRSIAEREGGVWRARIAAWREKPDRWQRKQWGPPPDDPGCMAPPQIIQEITRAA